MRLLCSKVVVVLEGGYDLNALSVSSEAVIETLRIHPQDSDAIDKYLTKLHSDNVNRLENGNNSNNNHTNGNINGDF